MINDNSNRRLKGQSEAELLEQLLRLHGTKRENNYFQRNSLIMDDYKKRNESKVIEDLNNNYLKTNKSILIKKLEIIDDPKEGYFSILGNENIIKPHYQEEIERFLNDNSSVLTIYSPSYFFKDIRVIKASLRRDINSIGVIAKRCGTLIKEVEAFVIIEAQRQNYVFREDTPNFLFLNASLIRQSIESDIKTIDYVPNEFLTEEIKTLALKLAKENGYVISTTGPNFLKKDIDIVKNSLTVDPQSADFISFNDFTPEQQEDLIQIIVDSEKNYILKDGSPEILKSNVNVCLKSIDADLSSIRYIDAQELSDEERKKIIDKLIERQYIIGNNTPNDIKMNIRLCLSSAKLDINCVRYFDDELKGWLDTRCNIYKFVVNSEEDEKTKKRLIELKNYLIENDYYSLEQFLQMSATSITDEVVLNYYLKKQGVSVDTNSEDDKKYCERIKEFMLSILNTPLKVSNAKKILRMILLKEWEKYKSENLDYYSNIFNRICDALEKRPNFIEAITELNFLMKVDDVLEERKYALFNAFIEYHHIYHNPKIKDKSQILQQQRDKISEYAALFIAKSKESFISERENELESHFKKLFAIKVDNPVVKKKVVEVKQRDMLKKLYDIGDKDLLERITGIKEKYLNYNFKSSIELSELSRILDLFITNLINNRQPNIDEILPDKKPKRFEEYEKYEKVSKLINRLNSNNISYDGREVDAYRHLIIFDGQKYIYNGDEFSERELIEINTYKELKYIYEKVRSEIIKLAKGIAKFDDLTEEDIKEVINGCPFTNEFYEYSFDIFHNKKFHYTLKMFNNFLSIFENNKNLILNDNLYKSMKELIINEGLYQFGILQDIGSKYFSGFPTNRVNSLVSEFEVKDIIRRFNSIASMFGVSELNIDNLSEILEVKKMFEYGDIKQISLLGKDVIRKIYNSGLYTSVDSQSRVDIACDLFSKMVSRSESTVPYVSGECGKYRYSMYYSMDETLLTSGIDTQACFRCCGNDNDFLHYCALDKNGFVIKITDQEGNFIGRASGFRNGNGVYINQLRTIYDKKSSASRSEKESIIKAFKQACNDIVEISQNNPDEVNKIDFVVVTKSYLLDGELSNVSSNVRDTIGNYPMENKSSDWQNFVSTTKNLRESKREGYFTTDYKTGYSLICMKSAVGELTSDKIKKGDVGAVYTRKRKRISIDNLSDDIINHINKVRACYAHLNNTNFEYFNQSYDCKVINGDNWYIILGSEGVIDSRYLSSDTHAIREFGFIIEQIKNEQEISLEFDERGQGRK